jgi:hypothetical protein
MSAHKDSLLRLVEAVPKAHRDLVTATNDDEFNKAFAEIVAEAVGRLEKNSKDYSSFHEDPLTSIFVDAVNGTWALLATREEYSNGHVDITFKAPLCQPPRQALGEAKIFNYYDWHEKGLSQLHNRYSTGRESRGLLLVYVKVDQIKDRMEKLSKEMNEKRPCQQISESTPHTAKWSFVTTHKHTSGEEMEVWHLGCNLYHPESEATKGVNAPKPLKAPKKPKTKHKAPKGKGRK